MNLQEELIAIQSQIEKQKNFKAVDSILYVKSDLDALETQEADILRQIMEEKEQVLEAKVEEAKTTGYLLDTLTASNGMGMAELSHTPETHELVARAVQKAFLAQQDAFNRELDSEQQARAMFSRIADSEKERADKYQHDLYTLDIEKQDVYKKLANATDIIAEKDAEIKALKEQQSTTEAIEVAPLSAEEAETKLVAELMGSRLKVTNLRFKDESGIDRRKILANNALTGAEIEDFAIYTKSRYEEISQEEAAQLQADYAQKKADIEAQNAPQEIVQLQTIDEPSELNELPRIDHEITGEQFRFSNATTQNEPVVQPTTETVAEDHTELPIATEQPLPVILPLQFTVKHEQDIIANGFAIQALSERILVLERLAHELD